MPCLAGLRPFSIDSEDAGLKVHMVPGQVEHFTATQARIEAQEDHRGEMVCVSMLCDRGHYGIAAFLTPGIPPLTRLLHTVITACQCRTQALSSSWER